MKDDLNHAMKKAFLEAVEESKQHIIGGTTPKVVSTAMRKVLELEEFGESPETIHTMQEGHLVKAMFYCHAVGVERYADTLIRMVKDGVLIVNYKGLDKAMEKFKNLEVEGEDEEDLED